MGGGTVSSAAPLELDTCSVAVPGRVERATASHTAALVSSLGERVTWMATEFLSETAQAAETSTSGPTRRLPRRALGFYYTSRGFR